jgi:hypothetical protein
VLGIAIMLWKEEKSEREKKNIGEAKQFLALL